MKKIFLFTLAILPLLIACKQEIKEKTTFVPTRDSLSADSAKAIAKDAWIYGYSIIL